jgi:hypothetical protein
MPKGAVTATGGRSAKSRIVGRKNLLFLKKKKQKDFYPLKREGGIRSLGADE